MLHNYCHWLGFAVKENEYTFNAANTARLWDAMAHADANLPIHLLSYFGHYGVPVFLFLSGFGLVMKYERRPQELPAWRFARYHYMKLLRMMVPGFVAFIIVDAITPGPFRFQAENVVAQMLMAINLLPAPDRIIWPGPYWFFGLMMQLYIVYRLALYRRHWAWAAALVALCWAAQAACSPMGETLNRLRYNCIGGMLVFCAGLLAARHLPAARINAMGPAGRGGSLGGAGQGAARRVAQPAVVARRHIGGHVRGPSAAAQGVHTHIPPRRYLRRTAAVCHSHGGRVVDVHDNNQQDSKAKGIDNRRKTIAPPALPAQRPGLQHVAKPCLRGCKTGRSAMPQGPFGGAKRAILAARPMSRRPQGQRCKRIAAPRRPCHGHRPSRPAAAPQQGSRLPEGHSKQ